MSAPKLDLSLCSTEWVLGVGLPRAAGHWTGMFCLFGPFGETGRLEASCYWGPTGESGWSARPSRLCCYIEMLDLHIPWQHYTLSSRSPCSSQHTFMTVFR